MKVNSKYKKRSVRYFNFLSSLYVGISLLGLLLIIILTFYTLPIPINNSFIKIWIELIFSIICIIGIFAGTFPSKCSRFPHFKNIKDHDLKKGKRFLDSNISFKGHHPSCGNYSSHTLQFNNQIFCAGCLGLIIGAFSSLFGIFLHASAIMNIAKLSVLIFYIGIISVSLGLLQYYINVFKSGTIHFFINIFFVLGSFFLLIGSIEINGNILLETFLLVLITYLIITRIMLSKFDHEKTCLTCNDRTCDSK